jgi:signal transduction histidine kinase
MVAEISTTARLVDAAERYRTLLEITNAVIPDPGLTAFRFFALTGELSSKQGEVGDLVDPKGSCFGAAFELQRPILRGDLNLERVFPSDERLQQNGMRSYCTVPLIFHGRSVGAMGVVSRLPHRYSADDADFLQEVANQLALAVVNMQAYEEIAALRKRLQAENRHLREEVGEAESQVLLAENAALLGRFAAALCHELNSAIGALRSALESRRALAERERKQPEQGAAGTGIEDGLWRTMLGASERLGEVISRMKRLTNLDRGEVLVVDLNSRLRDVSDLLQPALRQRVRVELDLAALPRLKLKPQQMSALFMVVLQNAVDEASQATLVKLATRQEERQVVVVVTDNGRGVPEGEIEGIFEPSFRVKGTRVTTGNWSLFGARQLVQARGGRIEVRSAPGMGTSVAVRLPLSLACDHPQWGESEPLIKET